ncbi:MAG: hypothetical protein AABW85_00955 [archaeon]
MFGQRGQEAAPFELLVAVVIMGFVLLAGVNVMDVLRKEECKGQLDNQLEKIKVAIESVVSGEGQKDFSFTLPTCFQRNQSRNDVQPSLLKIIDKQSRQICSAYCTGGKVECMLLWFSSQEHHNVKCLNISTVTNFPAVPGQEPCNDNFEGLTVKARDLKEPIEDGQYLLVRKFYLGSTSADICAYKKEVR